jgi:hypothetical protein
MQEEVISDISQYAHDCAGYNTTEVPTTNCAEGFALHSDPSEP